MSEKKENMQFAMPTTEDLKKEKDLISAEEKYTFAPLPRINPQVGFDVYVPEGSKTNLTPFEKTFLSPDQILVERARNQPWYEQLGKATLNLGPNILINLAEMAGFAGELGNYAYNELKGEDYKVDFSNAFTETVNKWRDPFGKVYRTDPSSVFDLGDFAWWVTNGSSLIESIAGFGAVARGVGTLAKIGMNAVVRGMQAGVKSAALARGIARGGDVAATAITSASLGYLEGAKTGAPVFNEVFNQKYAETGDYNFAIQEASKSAAATVKTNTAFIGALSTTAVVPYMISKGFINQSKRFGLGIEAGEEIIDYQKRMAGFQGTVPEESLFMKYRIPFEMVQESTEELANVYAEEIGYQKAGISEYDKTGLELFFELGKTDEGKLSMILGAIGGAGQTMLMDYAPWYKRKDEEGKMRRMSAKQIRDMEIADMGIQYAKQIANDMQAVINAQEQLQTAINKGDDVAIEYAREELFDIYEKMSIRFDEGDSAIAFLTQLSNVDNKQELQEVYAEQIEMLEEAKAEATPEQIAQIDTNIAELQEKIKQDMGKTMAMKMGLADSKDDNEYKQKASNKINEIKELAKKYKNLVEAYDYGDQESAGLADYAFNLEMSEKAISSRIKSYERLYNNYKEKFDEFNKGLETEEYAYVSSALDAFRSLSAVEKQIAEKEKELANIDENIVPLRSKYNVGTRKEIQATIKDLLQDLKTEREVKKSEYAEKEKELSEYYQSKKQKKTIENIIQENSEKYGAYKFQEQELIDAEKAINEHKSYLELIKRNKASIETAQGRKEFVERAKKAEEEEIRKLKEIRESKASKKAKERIVENNSKKDKLDPAKSVTKREAEISKEEGTLSTRVKDKLANKVFYNLPKNDEETELLKERGKEVEEYLQEIITPEMQAKKEERKANSDAIIKEIIRKSSEFEGLTQDGKIVPLTEQYDFYAVLNKKGDLESGIKNQYARATSIVTSEEFDSPYKDQSQKFGNALDEFIRDYFENDGLSDEQLASYDFADRSELKELRKILNALNKKFKKNGETIYARNIILSSESGFAGTVDIITTDEAGNFRIYDVKSMRNMDTIIKPVTKEGEPGTKVSKYDFKGYYDNEKKAYIEDDSYDSYREKHQKQLSLYNIALENTYGISAVELFVIPINVKYNLGDKKLSSIDMRSLIPVDILSFVGEHSLMYQGKEFDLSFSETNVSLFPNVETSESFHSNYKETIVDKKATSSFKIQYGAVRPFELNEDLNRVTTSNIRKGVTKIEAGLYDFSKMDLVIVPDVEYSGKQYDKDGNLVDVSYEQILKKGEIGNLPMKIVDRKNAKEGEEGEVIGYLPTSDWVMREDRGIFINMATGTDKNPIDIPFENEKLIELKEKAIEAYNKGERVSIDVYRQSRGSFIHNYKTVDGKPESKLVYNDFTFESFEGYKETTKVPVKEMKSASESLPDPDLKFGIVSNKQILLSIDKDNNRETAKKKDGRVVNIEKKDGALVVNLDGVYLSLLISNVSSRVANTLYEGIMAKIENNEKLIEDINNADPDTEFENKNGLFNFVKKFVFVKVFSLEKMKLNPDRVYVQVSQKGSIYIGKRDKIYTNEQRMIGGKMGHANVLDIASNKDVVKQLLSELNISVKLENLNRKNPYKELVIKDGEVSINTDNDYNSFIKQSLKTTINGTNFLDYKEGGKTKRKYIYREQPAIYFEEKVSEVKSEFQKGVDVKINTPAGLRDNLTGTIIKVEGDKATVRVEGARNRTVALRNLEVLKKEEPTKETEKPDEDEGPDDIFNIWDDFDDDVPSSFPRIEPETGLTEAQRKALSALTIGEFTGRQQKSIVMSMLYMVKKYVDKKEAKNEVAKYNEAFEYAKKSFQVGRDNLVKQGDEEVASIINDITVNYWDRFKELATSYLEKAGYRRSSESTIESEQSNYEKRKYDTQFDVDQKETAAGIVKMELFFIPKYEASIDKKTGKKVEKILSNFIGLPEFVPIQDIWPKIREELRPKIREELRNINPDIESFKNQLDASNSKSLQYVRKLLDKNEHFANNFFVAFNMQKITTDTVFVRASNKKVNVYRGQTDLGNEVNSILNDFSQSFIVNSPFVYEKRDGTYAINTQKVLDFKKLYTEELDKDAIIVKGKKKKQIKSVSESMKFLSVLLKKLGVYITDEELLNNMTNNSYLRARIASQIDFDTKNSFANQVFNILLGTSKSERGRVTSDRDNNLLNRNPFTSNLLTKDLREIAKAFIRRDGSKFAESHNNINNDIVYPWQKPNYLYDKLRLLQNDDYQEKLEEGILTKYSKMKTRSIELHYVDGLKNISSSFGKQMHKLDDIDLHLINMAYYFGRAAQTNGRRSMFVFTKSSKKVVPVFDMPIEKYSFRRVDKAESGNKLVSLPTKAVNALLEYVMAEYERVVVTKDQVKEGIISKDDPYYEGGQHFLFFPFLNYDHLKTYVDEGVITEKEFDIIYPTKDYLNSEIQRDINFYSMDEEVKPIIYKIVDHYFTNEVNRTYSVLDDYGLLGEKRVDKASNTYSIRNIFIGENYLNNQRLSSKEDTSENILEAVLNFVINSSIAKTEHMILFGGDPAHFWKGSVEATLDVYEKRGSKDIAPRSPGNYEKDEKLTRLVVNDIKKPILLASLPESYRKGVDISDGSQFSTVIFRINFLEKIGKIKPEEAQALRDKVKPGKYYEFTNEEVRQYFSPLKDVYTGEEYDAELKTFRPIYVKNATFVLLPQLFKRPDGTFSDLDKARIMLETKGIDLLPINSASKLGTKNIVQLFDENGLIQDIQDSDIERAVDTLSMEFYGLQQEEETKESKRINLITQFDTLLLAGIRDVDGFEYKGMTMKGRELERHKTEIIKQIYTQQRSIIYNELGIELSSGYPVLTSLKPLKKLLEKSAEKNNWSQQTIDSIKISNDGQSFTVPQEMTAKYESIQNLLFSALSKIAKVSMPGQGYVQAPGMLIGPSEAEFVEIQETETEPEPTPEPVEERSIEDQVAELFEFNPELANQVYEALGFLYSPLTDEAKLRIENRAKEEIAVFNRLLALTKKNNFNEAYDRLADIIIEASKDINRRDEYIELLKFQEYINTYFSYLINDINDKTAKDTKITDVINEIKETSEKDKAKRKRNKITPQQKQQALQLYSQYLDTIFPDSKVKDIVYRGGNLGTKQPQGVEAFTTSKSYAQYRAEQNNTQVYYAILNIKDSKLINKKETRTLSLDRDEIQYEDYGFTDNKDQTRQLGNFYTVKENNRHILGTKQDIEGFKDFAGVREEIPNNKARIIHTPTGRKGITSGEIDANTVTVTFDNGDVEITAKSELVLDTGEEVFNVTENPNQPEFNKLPSRSETPTMTYAGIGSRQTPDDVLAQMTEMAEYLESLGYTLNTGVTFRGRKEGADAAFEKGATNKNLFSPTDQGSREREQTIAKEIHPAPNRLKEGALKLMARNTNQIFGDNLDTPVDFVLFWAEETRDPLRPKGGTGQAVEMARRKGIPTINMSDSNWREKLNSVLGSQVSEETQSSAEEIYSELGTTTESENVIIKSWKELRNKKNSITNKGIISTRIQGTNEHFGNPFNSDIKVLEKNSDLIKTDSTKESVEKYIDWLTTDKYDLDHPLKMFDNNPEFLKFYQQIINNSKSNNNIVKKDYALKFLLKLLDRKKWIIEQLKSGKLKGKPIFYYKDLGEPSHATALDYLINKYNWSKDVKGINIRTDKNNPNSLGNRLTNPNWYSEGLFDVESAYKANASKVKAPELNAEEALRYDMNLMYKLQLRKFRQNPELIDEINEQGGLEFIKKSSHIVGVKDSRWEGVGMESNFIKVLAKSYETVSKELGKFVEGAPIKTEKYQEGDQLGLFDDISLFPSVETFNPESEEARKIQKKLQDLYPEIELTITNSPVWEEGDNVLNQEEYNNRVKYILRSVNILQSDKAEQLFAKGKKNGWNLDKILTELQIPKEQKKIIIDKNLSGREEIIIFLLADNSFVVEINTAKIKQTDTFIKTLGSMVSSMTTEYGKYYYTDERDIKIEIAKDSWEEAKKEFDSLNKIERYTKFYSDRTIPGGINYTENEIATPSITPSIKGHAQFATDKGIGWFRSDDKIPKIDGFKKNETAPEEWGLEDAIITELKTRRILEVQSDLFQKGRDKQELVKFETDPTKLQQLYKKVKVKGFDSFYVGETFEVNNVTFRVSEGSVADASKYGMTEEEFEFADLLYVINEENRKGAYLTKEGFLKAIKSRFGEEEAKAREGRKRELNQNKFLQLLNKKGNWVNFFIQSIIQDSAKKGYEKVLFPKGDTGSKIQGQTTLENFKKQKKDAIKINEKRLKSYSVQEFNNKGFKIYIGSVPQFDIFKTKEEAENKIQEMSASDINEINELKQELERIETEGFGALKPIYDFYENRVTNILKKLYDVKEITDEYGNTWNEIEITPSVLSEILLQRNEANRIIGQANIKAGTVLIDAINQKADTLPHEYAHHYIAWFRETPIVQEAIKKWGSEEELVQAIGEQVVKQKGEAYNWWKKFVKWIMNKINSLSDLQKQDLANILADAFLTRQDLTEFRLDYSKNVIDLKPELKQNLYKELGFVEAFQGYNESVDERPVNYFTLNSREAQGYGSKLRTSYVNTLDYLKGTPTDSDDYYKLVDEYQNQTGYRFDILDNSPEGLKKQQGFFEFLMSRGYKGLDKTGYMDSEYVVSFDNTTLFNQEEVDEKVSEIYAAFLESYKPYDPEDMNAFRQYVDENGSDISMYPTIADLLDKGDDVIKPKVKVSNLTGNENKVVTVKDFDITKGLQFIKNEAGKIIYAEVMVPWNFIGPDGNKLNINDFLDGDYIDYDKLPPELLEAVSSRIPNQAHSSMLPIKIVGFIPPSMGKTIIVPDGITLQMGSDFDIDKLYAYLASYYYDTEDGKLKVFTIDSDLEDSKAVYNELFGDMKKKAVSDRIAEALREYNKSRNSDKKIETFFEPLQDVLTPKQIAVLVEMANDYEIFSGTISESMGKNVPTYKTFQKRSKANKDDATWIYSLLPSKMLRQLYFEVHKSVLSNPKVFDLITNPLENQDIENEKQIIGKKTGQLKEFADSPITPLYGIENSINKWSGAELVGIAAIGLTMNAIIEDKEINLETYGPDGIVEYDIKFKVGGKTLSLNTISGTGTSKYNNELRTKIDNLKSFVTTAVDNENLNQAGFVNFNPYTAGVAIVMAMLQTKDGKALAMDSILRFLSQDVIRDFVKRIAKVSWSGNMDYVSKKYDRVFKDSERDLLESYLRESKLYSTGKKNVFDYPESRELIKQAKRKPIPDVESLTSMINSKNTVGLQQYYRHQLAVLYAFNTARNISEELSPVRTGLLAPFVRQLPPNIYDLEETINSINKIRSGGKYLSNLHTLLGKYSNLKGFTYDTKEGILAELLIYPSKQIADQVFPIFGQIMPLITGYYDANINTNNSGNLNSSQLKKLWNGVVSFLWQNTDEFGLGNIRDRRSYLFYEFPKKLAKAQTEDWGKNSIFLRKLQVFINENTSLPSTITYVSKKEDSAIEVDIINDIVDMLSSTDPQQVEMIQDLYEYGMLSGATFGPNKYLHKLPSVWFESEFTGIFDKVKNMANNFDKMFDVGEVVMQITRANTEFIPVYYRKNSEEIREDIDEATGEVKTMYFPFNKKGYPIAKSISKNNKYVKQFKIVNDSGEETLYQYVGLNNAGEAVFNIVSPLSYGSIPEYYPGESMPTSIFNFKTTNTLRPFSTIDLQDDIFVNDDISNKKYGSLLLERYFPSYKTVSEAIENSLDKISENEYYDQLAQIFKPALRNKKLNIVDRSTLPSYAGYSKNVLYFNSKMLGDERIPPSVFEQIILHEYGHAITDDLVAQYLKDPSKLTKKQKDLLTSLENVYKTVVKKITKGNEENFSQFQSKVQRQKRAGRLALKQSETTWYAIHSFEEFAASIWKEDFQEILNDIEYDSKRSFKDRVLDLLNKIMQSLANAFNIVVKDKTALKESLAIVIDLMQEPPKGNIKKKQNVPTIGDGNMSMDELFESLTSGQGNINLAPAYINPSIQGVISQTENIISQIKMSISSSKDVNERTRLKKLLNAYTKKLGETNYIRTPKDLLDFSMGQMEAANIILNRPATERELLLAFYILDTWDFSTTKDFIPKEMQDKNNVWYRAYASASAFRNELEGELLNKVRIYLADAINKELNLPVKVTPEDIATMEDLPAIYAALDASSSGVPILQYLNRQVRNPLTKANALILQESEAISNKIKELGFTKGGFDFMFQKDSEGNPTKRIVHEYTAEYDEAMSIIYSDLEEVFKAAEGQEEEAAKASIKKAVKKFHKERDKINDFIDVRFFAIDGYSNKKFDSKETYIKYLQVTYGKENADKFVAVAEKKLADYNMERELYSYDLVSSLSKIPVTAMPDSLKGESEESYKARKMKNWEAKYSPVVYLENKEFFQSITVVEGIEPESDPKKKTISNRGDDHIVFVPRKTVNGVDTNFYNDSFHTLTRQQKEWLEFFSDVVSRMVQYFPYYIQNQIPENFYPAIMKDLSMELLKTDMVKFLDKTILENFTAGTVSFSNVKELGTEKEKRRFKRNSRLGTTRDLIKYVDLRNEVSPEDISYNVELVLKRFVSAAILYKYKNDAEPVALLINRIIQNADEVDSEGRLVSRDKALINIKKQAEHMIKSNIYDDKADESKPSNFVMMDGWNIKENSAKRRRLKEIKREYLQLEISLADGKIDLFEYKEEIQKLETEYNKIGGRPLVMSKVLQSFLQINQLKHMGWNLRAGFANMGFGMLSVFTWSAGNNEFSTNDVVTALGLMMKSGANRKDLRITNIVKKMNVLFEVRDVTFGRGNSRLETDVSKLKFISKNIPAYRIQSLTEFFVQGLSTVSQMINTKIEVTRVDNGKKETIPLFYAFDSNGDWNTKLYEKQEDWDYINGDKMANFRNKVIKTNYYMHGNYDPDNMPPIKRSVYMRALFQFRSWIPYGFAQRFIPEYYDADLGRMFKGRYRTFADIGVSNSLKGLLSFMFLSKEKATQKLEGDKISAEDISNLRMNLRELQILAGLIFFAFLIKSAMPDDDEEDEFLRGGMQILLNQLFRIEQDIYFYVSPRTLEDILRNPVPVFKLYIDYANAIRATIEYLSNPSEYERDHPLKKFAKANPGSNQYVNMMYSATNSYRDK